MAVWKQKRTEARVASTLMSIKRVIRAPRMALLVMSRPALKLLTDLSSRWKMMTHLFKLMNRRKRTKNRQMQI